MVTYDRWLFRRVGRLREVVANERWSLMKDGHKRVVDNRWLFMAGSDYRPLNDKKLVFCIGSHSEK